MSKQRWPFSVRQGITILGVIILSLILVPSVLADIEVPGPGLPVFIQTSGRHATLGTGDYRTNVAGDNLPHELVINVPCVPNAQFAFDLFDPALDVGTVAIDEIRSGVADDATFTLLSPAGASLITTTYTTGTSNDAWTTLTTVTMPASPTQGVDCGEYTLRVTTGVTDPADPDYNTTSMNNDDNAWRFRLRGANDGSGNTFDTEDGPDGVLGTGDEAWLGLLYTSYQHDSANPPSCQNFYWFSDQGDSNMYMTNFDMDGNDRVCYFPPGVSGTCTSSPAPPIIQGTVSSATVWNDAAPQQQSRPGYSDMETFDSVADFAGDAIASPAPGPWRAELCVGNNNQYSFEVPGKLVFIEPPDQPNITIDKDDGVTQVTSPGSTTYTVTLTNTGTGAALPLPGSAVEFTDTLPAGLTFVSCTINAPLVGTCTYDAGTRTIEADLTGNTAYPRSILPGTAAAPNNTGTITIAVTVDGGLPGGTDISNTATFDYTDIYGNNYTPVSDTDTDTVAAAQASADLRVSKSVTPTQVSVGDTVTFTIQVTNDGPDTATGVEVTDSDLIPGGNFINVSVVGAPSHGTYTVATGVWAIGTLDNGETATLTVQADVNAAPPLTNTAEVTASDQPDPDSTPNNHDPSEDDQASVTLQPPGSSTPTPPPGPSGPAINLIDPALSKRGVPTAATPGEAVTWIVEVYNPGSVATNPVTVQDTIPGQFSIRDVIVSPNSAGSASVNGQTVSISIGSLQPGDRVTISIETVASESAAAGEICNTATAGDASATACISLFPELLPLTGGPSPAEVSRRQLGQIVGIALLAAAITWLAFGRVRRAAR
ncbi:MAG TPA: DUF11 domain-containing protein [Chloroflexi bacterium]|nr:DUF11 domain-containing protein [Chloroflexota bacterium]